MYTSDINQKQRQMAKASFIYLLISLFCVLFGMIYEHFSHEVYSGYMIYAFLFPLIMCTLVFFVLALFGRRFPGAIALNLYHSSVTALTVGSIFRGVLDIYGTDNPLIAVYWVSGITLGFAAVICYIISCLKK